MRVQELLAVMRVQALPADMRVQELLAIVWLPELPAVVRLPLLFLQGLPFVLLQGLHAVVRLLRADPFMLPLRVRRLRLVRSVRKVQNLGLHPKLLPRLLHASVHRVLQTDRGGRSSPRSGRALRDALHQPPPPPRRAVEGQGRAAQFLPGHVKGRHGDLPLGPCRRRPADAAVTHGVRIMADSEDMHKAAARPPALVPGPCTSGFYISAYIRKMRCTGFRGIIIVFVIILSFSTAFLYLH